jgi:hypothetical protein
MSSSRSIAAARNRRVVVPPPAPPPVPPRQQQKPMQQQKQQPARQEQLQKPKISVGDAIGLTTIRLGRVEQQLANLMQNPLSLEPNTQVVDNSVFETMLNRLEFLEKRDVEQRAELDVYKTLVDERFSDIDAAFVELEQQQHQQQQEVVGENNVELTIEE